MKKFILYITVAASLLAGCRGKEPDRAEANFVAGVEDVSVTVNGTAAFTYNRFRHQMAYNSGTNQYRVMDDRMNNFICLTLDGQPRTAGETITGELIYTTSSDIVEVEGTFSVSKISGGRIWLWLASKKTGVVVDQLSE